MADQTERDQMVDEIARLREKVNGIARETLPRATAKRLIGRWNAELDHVQRWKEAGSPSFCWHCGKQLRRAKGVRNGLFYFRLVEQDGVQYRVHGTCLPLMLGDGVRQVPTDRRPPAT